MRKSIFLPCVAGLWLLLTAVTASAQQLPDPGFEDWSGARFANTAQPRYWNYSNVSQMGVDKNFAHQTTGRSGSALKIQDQFVGVLGIGATSPGYVALGVPWAYVSSLTTIEDATAGTYGGIAWTSRPDSMVVWIKRYYDSSADNAAGDHSADENFNLIFYSWSGTSHGTSYKAKNLSCTDISASHANDYCVDEESDIRLALNGNECGTPVPAKQIAEGWYYEKKAYPNWTRISVPIYYFNDDIPEKCNVILSAGNYPNFRANSGQNAGMSLDADDISLVYSSKIQKLYVDGREWKAFDPDNTGEQVYSLGIGATAVPTVSAVRGAGSLTNNRGGKATFPGRRLTASECTVTYGQVDGEPTLITVRAEDNSSTTTYRIKFVSQTSSNARLSGISVDGQPLNGFNPYLTNYTVSLPYGTTEAPVVTASAQDATATVQITQAASPSGTATVLVTAGDGTTQMTYTVVFSVAPLTDVTLQAVYIDGNLLPGFTPAKSNYTVSLPLGTETAPQITWSSAYADGVQTVTLLNNTLEQGAQIQVSLPGTALTKTYKITYKIEPSSYSWLAGIFLDGAPLADFSAERTAYTITLPMGTQTMPVVTWTTGDAWQTVRMTEGGVDGVTRIEVTAANGTTTVYRLTFQTEKSDNNALAAIAVDGEPIVNYDPDTLQYRLFLPAGTTALPAVTYTAGDEYQRVTVSANPTQMTVRLTVTAGNGSIRVYLLTFEVEKSANALLQMIYLDGEELEDFVPSQLDYALVWQGAQMPKVTVLAYPGQAVTIAAPASYGLVRIVVTPEQGTPNTYTLRLRAPGEPELPPFPTDSFPASDNTALSALYIGGELYTDFDPGVLSYTYPLPWHTCQVPAVVPVPGTPGQTVTVAHGQVDRPTTIRVLAADKTSERTYTVLFPVAKSSNTALASVEIDGVEFSFDPAVTSYTDLPLPYGTTHAPTLTVERGEPGQALVITEAPVGKPSTILVTAEDGTQATYSFSYRMAWPDKSNELTAIILDGIGPLDMEQGPDFTLDLPYGTTGIDIVSVAKNYPEQEVFILNGGIHEPTTVTVKSLNPSEPDKVYTVTPHVYPYDPAQLTDIQLDGVSLAQFNPGIYSYVLSVSGGTPVVTYTAQDGAEVDTDSNAKWVKLTVTAGENEEYTHTYLVTFYYPGDLTFDLDFENWVSHLNDNTNTSGSYPQGWKAPINAVTSGDAGTYHPEDATQFVTSPKTHGSKAAELATTYLLTSAEAMPGFLSLSQPTVSVGKWLLGVYEIHSSLAFGDPVSFRNTPDHVALDYYLDSYQNKANGWKFVYNANGMQQINHAQAFSTMTAKKWYTCSQVVSYPADFIPMTLDILICSAPSTVLEDYYTNFGTSRSTSKMYVDNLRLDYSSVLDGLAVNGLEASFDGTQITATVDAEWYGQPVLDFRHAVPDQMPFVVWSEETDGVRTAAIRNYAEDLSYTDYLLTVTRPKSANTACTWALNGTDLTVTKGSPFQTIAVTSNDTAYVITVTAESGAQQVYYASWTDAAGVSMTVTQVPAESPVTGVSTARLTNLVTAPVVNYEREYALDSVTMVTTDTCLYIKVSGSGTAADTTYVIALYPSSNALLASMSANDAPVADFYEQTFAYTVSLPSLDAFAAVPQDANAEARYTVVPVDETHVAVFVLVTAEDGHTQSRYSVLVRLHDPAGEAYLTALTADDEPVPGFESSRYDYTIHLPAGSAIPQLAAVTCEGASVETNTVKTGSSALVTFVVTSEDGLAQQTYAVHVDVDPSDVCTLVTIYAGDEVIDIQPGVNGYTVDLPYGAAIPEPGYVLTDNNSTASVLTDGTTVTITVTAEDGIHTAVYTLTFNIAKSTNADLRSVSLDGMPMTDFFADEYAYTVALPFGTPVPVITAEPAEPVATVTVENGVITVTAEDGVTTKTYVFTFTWLPSTNANLASIALDGRQQPGFAPDIYEYRDTVIYGNPLPAVTWITADEQQQVDTTWVNEDELVISVTAGDGLTTAEYVLTFVYLRSSNAYLADLQVRGETIEGFRRDSFVYTLVYPAGTDSAALCDETHVTAIAEDPEAVVAVAMTDGVIQIFVTAQDGSINVYTIEQIILLSSEARLRMIWLDSAEVRNYHMDTLSYTVILTPGAKIPGIDAEPVDPLATWDLGMETEVENGRKVELYCTAEDGTTMTYTLTFRYADWTASGTVDADDYLFVYIGSGQYKAVTIGIGVQVAVYDFAGRLMLLETLPTADPADVEVEVQENGNQVLKSASFSADGVVFNAAAAHPYFYVFFDSKTKRIAKGGKFEWQN